MKKIKFHTNLLPATIVQFLIKTLSLFTRVSEKTAHSHLLENEERWREYKEKTGFGFIERQHDFENLKYGSQRNMLSKMLMGGRPLVAARNSCEVISVYNALKDLGDLTEENDFPKLLYYFEKNAIVLKGYFGTSFSGIKKYFKTNGYEIKSFTGRKINKENIDFLEKEYNAYVFMTYNNRYDISDMIHTMSISHEKKGFVIHNSYSRLQYYDSLYDAVIHYNESDGFISRPIVVLGIRKHESI